MRDVLGVEPPRCEDLTDRDEGVRGSAENRFRLLKVALKGLVGLVGERDSSGPGPLLVLGGGSGGNIGERTDGEREIHPVSGKRCALPFGEDPTLISWRLIQLDSRRNSIAGRRS